VGQEASTGELERRFQALEAEQAAEIDRLERQVEALTSELEEARSAAPGSETPSIFNPAISVMGTFIGRADDKRAFVADDPLDERIDDRMSLREVEIDLRAAVSPSVEGVLIAAFEQDGDYQRTGIEEGYLTLGRLPVLNVTPAGLRIKVGKFRASFGRLNRVHVHDLPQVTYPRSLERFLGTDGYLPTGVSGQFFLLPPRGALALEGTLELLNGGDVPPQSSATASDAAGLAQVRAFAELSPAHTLDLGVSAWSDGSERSLYGIYATYEWSPPAQGTWRSFILGSEFFRGDFDQAGLDGDPLGGYAYAQYQLDAWTYCGARYDRSEELDDEELETDSYSVYVTRYAAKYLRFRLAYERAESDLELVDGRDTLLLEINYVYGAHPIDPYWVHR